MNARDFFRRAFLRRHQRVSMRPYNDSEVESSEPPTLERALDEGLLISEYALRTTLKNVIAIRAITSDDRYDPSSYLPDARSALQDIAVEADEAATRIGRERELAVDLDGVGEHVHDYRLADDANLRFRQTTASSAASVLREKSEDDAYLLTLIEKARQEAWAEVADAMLQNASGLYAPAEADYDQRRPERLDGLLADLRALRRRP